MCIKHFQYFQPLLDIKMVCEGGLKVDYVHRIDMARQCFCLEREASEREIARVNGLLSSKS